MAQRRVVVTGLGATTPLGGDVASTWSALLAGKSGVRLLTEEWAQTIPVHFAARVEIDPSLAMERVEMRRLDRSEQFALIASREAWKDAGSPDVDTERLGVVIASGQDDQGSALFIGGMKIDADTGELTGPPFEQSVNRIATRAAIARSF